jgi:hypothetical protein
VVVAARCRLVPETHGDRSGHWLPIIVNPDCVPSPDPGARVIQNCPPTSPRHRPARSRRERWPVALPFAIAAAASCGVLTSAAGAAPPAFSSWSVAPRTFFQPTYYASATTEANGRVWQMSFERLTAPVLRWRRLTDGQASSVAVKITRPRGGELLDETSTDSGLDAQLLIAGTRGFIAGEWCVSDDDEGDCDDSRGFYVQFDTRTGKVFRSAQPKEPPLLIAGTRISYVDVPDTGPMVLRDAITRRRVFTFPRDAGEIQGAGPYISWKSPDAYERKYDEQSGPGELGPNWDTMHVRRRTTGRRVYDLQQSTLRRVIQRRGAVAQDADLRPDGSVYLGMELEQGKPFYPAVVDRTGHVRRIARRPMRKPSQFWSEMRGDRVLLDVETNGEGTCGPEAGWLTEIGGRRGNPLTDLPHSRGFAASQTPAFMSPTTMVWVETPTDSDAPVGQYRVRVGRDLRSLPLTTQGRPRC